MSSFIQATGTVEFENGLGMGVFLEGDLFRYGDWTGSNINSNLLLGSAVVMWTPLRSNYNLLGCAYQWYQITVVR